MADFRVSKAKKKGESKEARPVSVTPDPEVSRSLLAKVGGGAASGLHTIGSILSTPSRVLWGGINGLAGGEGGFGNMNPLDSTGGIELSHVLGNAGVIAKNDPTKWEWGDLGRGIVDIAGDPTSWAGVGGLTKAGVKASKVARGTAGSLESSVINQFRAGQRGLVSVHHPLSVQSRGAFGTGDKVADAIESVSKATNAPQIAKAVGESTPIRLAKALQAKYRGKTHVAIQRYAPHNDEMRRAAQRQIDRDYYATATKMGNDKLENASADPLRNRLEGLNGAPTEHVLLGDSTDPSVLAKHAAYMQLVNDEIHMLDKRYGFKTAESDDSVAHFPRYLSEGVELEQGGQHGFERSATKLHSRDEVLKHVGGTTSLNRIVTDPEIDKLIRAMSNKATGEPGLMRAGGQKALPFEKQVEIVSHALRQKYGHVITEAMPNGNSRIEELARKMVGSEGLRKEGLFKNHPLTDQHIAQSAGNTRRHNADLMFNAIGDDLHHGDKGASVRSFLDDNGFIPEEAAAHIANLKGIPVEDVLNGRISHELAGELQSFAPGYRVPDAEGKILKVAKSLQTAWKAAMLAMPASRTRDFGGGVFQNAAMEHAGVKGFNLARNVVHGKPIGTDFSHLPEVSQLIRDHKLTHDEAVRVILAVEAPRQHGAVADIAPGQIGTTLEDILHNIPGRTKSGIREVFGRAVKSLRQGEIGRGGVPVSTGSVYNPANATGVLENVISGDPRRATGFGPYAASNVLSGAGDEFNRHAGILGQMAQDYAPSVAGQRTRAAQVDYDPSTYSAIESNVLKNLAPFYSFASRMGKHTAGELIAHPGGRTAQLIKAEDRAHAQDPSLPDSVLSGTSIPLGASEDGTKRLLQGAGLMHEQAVNTLGAALGGNVRGAMYDAAGMLNPLLRVPAEQMTGQSFFQRGEPQSNLDPNIGRTLSNVAVMAGQRDPEAGPVKYPGSHAVETAIGISPLSRIASTVRTLTDTRKSAAEKAANTLTGAKITSISPKKQAYTLIRRAEDLAKASGAKSRADVYFSRNELDKIKESDPELYEKQKGLQTLLNNLKAQTKKPSTAKPKSGKSKIKRVEKAPKTGSKKAPGKKFERVQR